MIGGACGGTGMAGMGLSLGIGTVQVQVQIQFSTVQQQAYSIKFTGMSGHIVYSHSLV